MGRVSITDRVDQWVWSMSLEPLRKSWSLCNIVMGLPILMIYTVDSGFLTLITFVYMIVVCLIEFLIFIDL